MEIEHLFWHSMESLPTLSALMPEWEFALGDHFLGILPFLKPSHLQADSYPCTHDQPCGCRHHLFYHSHDNIEAICECEHGACDPIHRRPADLVIYTVDIPAMARAIRQTLGFDSVEITPHGPRTWQIGTWNGHRTPVFFHAPLAANDLLHEVESLSTTLASPMIMTTPTSRPCDAVVQGILHRQGSIHIPLADTIAVSQAGEFRLTRSIQPLLELLAHTTADTVNLQKTLSRIDRQLQSLATNAHTTSFSTQPCSDSTAIQLFALVKQLESESHWRNAPILQVFRLYCMKSLTAEQIAHRCACAKSLIILRLRQLRQKLGRNPAELRQYSSHFEAITNSLSDPRARKIRPDNALDERENEQWEDA